ncbi:inositol monophosphatase family protein [Muricoccus radiodurans]|uniref:inositol monophosphatase family protein n=1 Tax=Muricoccus radiodurans TaxID=2231721 RepID=UPI003CF5AF79
MTNEGLDRRQAFAISLVLEAGRLARSMHASLGPLEVKNPIDFCTEADHAVELLVRERVASTFGEAVLGEEGGGRPADDLWVVDPIDGTAGYIHGTPRWCVALSFVQRGTVQIAATYAPVDDRLFVARRGGGATMNGRPISVSHLRHGAAPVVEVGWSGRRTLDDTFAVLRGLTDRGMEFRRHGSGALALAEVAAGLSDGYVEIHMNAWDCLGGLLLVSEAGGKVNDFLAGGDGLMAGNLVAASTPEIAPQLSEMLGEPLR